MKTNKIFLILILYLFALISAANASENKLYNINDFEQRRTKTFNVNKGGKLYVNVKPGSVKIHTWSKNEAVVKIRNLDDDELNNVEMNYSNNLLTVKYLPGWGWGEDAEFLITIPSQFNVEVRTSGGNVAIDSDIDGNVEINSMGGNITTTNIKGLVKLTTQGGDVKVGNVNGNLFINTMGGNINVGSIKGDNTKINTMSGEITIDKIYSKVQVMTYGGNININEVSDEANIETMGGNIQILNVNGKLKMETKGGNLRIKKADGSLIAVTYGGNIELFNISGNVYAKTLSGNITSEINPVLNSKSQFYSLNGEIEITLPSLAKTEIEAEIKGFGGRYLKDFYKIESDYQPKEFYNSEAKIKGIYIINGGGSKIYISTTNGNIKINKKR